MNRKTKQINEKIIICSKIYGKLTLKTKHKIIDFLLGLDLSNEELVKETIEKVLAQR